MTKRELAAMFEHNAVSVEVHDDQDPIITLEKGDFFIGVGLDNGNPKGPGAGNIVLNTGDINNLTVFSKKEFVTALKSFIKEVEKLKI